MPTTDPTTDTSGKIDTLSPAKRALLELRLKQQSRLASQEPIPCRDRSQPARLSFAQELLWLQDQIKPGPAYNVPRAVRLSGALDVDALTATLKDLVARHEILRTRFVVQDGIPIQVIDEGAFPPLEFIDLQSIPESAREAEAVRLFIERANRPFNLTADLLLRASLLVLGPEAHVLVLITHHIASDGWSRDVLFREISELYDAHHTGRPANLPELQIQYADFAAWQREAMEGYALKKQMAYWKDKLTGAPALLELPTDFPRPETQSSEGGRVMGPLLDTQELRALKSLAQQESATLFMATLACAKLFLYRHTHQDDIVVGTPIAGRNRVETQGMLGYFVNTLVLRTKVNGAMTYRQVLRQVRQMSLEAFENPDVPYARLVAELNPERTLSYSPVFQLLFGFGQLQPGTFPISDLTAAPFNADRMVAKFDLTISTSDTGTNLVGGMEYRKELFTKETVARMLARLGVLFRAVIAQPDAPADSLELLPEEERARLVEGFNDTATPYPPAAHLPELFEAQVARTPDKRALEFDGETHTYAQLNARANRLAHELRAGGVGPDTRVGILLPRSDERVVAMLAVLKAGGAYVPLDENYPPERIQYVLETADAPIVLTQRSFCPTLSAWPGRIIQLDRESPRICQRPDHNPEHALTPQNLAYVMFTSGSTGAPKGIAVPHRALVHFVRAATQTYGVTERDRVLQFGSIAFDTSIEEIFPTLCVGGTVVVRTDAMLDSLETFWRSAAAGKLTFISLPTAFWHELTRAADESGCPVPDSLRLVVIGGEKARADRLAAWRRQVGDRVQLLNTYGPTESTVVATACDITAPIAGEVPIGRPLPNVRAYLLDPAGNLVPRGVAGELCLGGDGIALGYLKRPDLTAERFIDDPFTPGGRLYRTGDLAKWNLDDQLEFLGRGDNQIKIRGFRIELEEIESVLTQHPKVRDAAVVAPEVDGERRLLAYVEGDADPAALRAYLQERLAAFMVPAAFQKVEAFARTSGGKIDRRALPTPEWDEVDAAEDAAFVAAETATEEEIAAIWKGVLGLSHISVDANFFDLGGHSLLAIRMLSQLGERGTTLTLAEMLQAPTVRTMAAALDRKASGVDTWSPLVPLQPNGARAPLFCAPVGGGSAFYYRTLALRMGEDQPVYTFEPIGMSGAHPPHGEIPEMAAYYLRHVRKVQPHGPYVLAGLSFGGMVAYEMACQLEAAGETVGALILFDTWAPGAANRIGEEALRRRRQLIHHLHYKLRFHTENLSACPDAGAKVDYVRNRVIRVGRMLRQVRAGKSLEILRDNPARTELPEVFQKVKKAERGARERYQPGVFTGRVVLLRANHQRPGTEKLPALGWEHIAAQTEVTATPGTHFSLLEDPCVHVTVRHVRNILDQVR